MNSHLRLVEPDSVERDEQWPADESDGRLMLGVAVKIRELHAGHCPGPESRVATELLRIADRLECRGLAALGAARERFEVVS